MAAAEISEQKLYWTESYQGHHALIDIKDSFLLAHYVRGAWRDAFGTVWVQKNDGVWIDTHGCVATEQPEPEKETDQ